MTIDEKLIDIKQKYINKKYALQNKKIKCKCGRGCNYIASTYERVNDLACNNSRIKKI